MSRFFTARLVLVALLASGMARAQPMPFQVPERGWTFTVTPYFWAAGVNGTVTTPFERVPQRDVAADFDTVLSDISGLVLMGSAEARKDRVALVADIVTIALTSDVATPQSTLFAGGKGDLDLTFVTVSAVYRVVEDERGLVDLGLGMRAWWASTSLRLNSGVLPGREVGASSSWADPVATARDLLRLSDAFSLSAYGDVGGLGVGSDLTWQVIGTVDWKPAPWVALRAGWRYLVVDRSSEHLSIDVSMNGPILGATFRF